MNQRPSRNPELVSPHLVSNGDFILLLEKGMPSPVTNGNLVFHLSTDSLSIRNLTLC